MTPEIYDDLWNDSAKARAYIEQDIQTRPEIYPAGAADKFQLVGFTPESKKLPGRRNRQIRVAGVKYTLRPSFIMPFFCGETEEMKMALMLLSHNVPYWLVTYCFGRNDMFWHRMLEQLGRNSVVGTTISSPENLPKHLAADEHHADWQGETGYVAMTASNDCVLGIALTDQADQSHLEEAYGVFAAEARELSPDYAPETVNTDGWFATSNTFATLFPTAFMVLCYLHGFLKVRDRCRKAWELHTRIWEVYNATNIRMFDNRMKSFRKWFEGQTWSPAVSEVVAKLWKRAKQYRVAYRHAGCYRTSNQVDRPMNCLKRLLYASRSIHGNLASSELRLRGWALLYNFRDFAPRAGQEREYSSRAHKINQHRYHEDWLQNLMISTSLAGRKTVPKKC